MKSKKDEKHYPTKLLDNSTENCYLRYSNYHHLNGSNVGRFEEFITNPSVFTNSLTNQLEVLSL